MRPGPFLVVMALGLASAMDFVFEHPSETQSEEQMEHGRRELIRNAAHRKLAMESDERLAELVELAREKNFQSRWLRGHVQCLLRDGTSDDELQDILRFICAPGPGNHSCHGIKPGGSHYLPNTPWDHAEWAMTSFHDHRSELPGYGFRACWFGGAAYLMPPPLNVLFLTAASEQSHPATVPATERRARLAVSGQYERGGDDELLRPGAAVSYTIEGLTAIHDFKARVEFELHVVGSGAVAVTVEISVDASGDGVWEYQELFPEFRAGAAGGGGQPGGGDGGGPTRHYVPRELFNVSAGGAVEAIDGSLRFAAPAKGRKVHGALRNLAGGALRLRVTNSGDDEVRVLHASPLDGAPSFLAIPYFPH